MLAVIVQHRIYFIYLLTITRWRNCLPSYPCRFISYWCIYWVRCLFAICFNQLYRCRIFSCDDFTGTETSYNFLIFDLQFVFCFWTFDIAWYLQTTITRKHKFNELWSFTTQGGDYISSKVFLHTYLGLIWNSLSGIQLLSCRWGVTIPGSWNQNLLWCSCHGRLWDRLDRLPWKDLPWKKKKKKEAPKSASRLCNVHLLYD